MDVIMIVSLAKNLPRTELQFPLWQITTQETLNNLNADIHVCINFEQYKSVSWGD